MKKGMIIAGAVLIVAIALALYFFVFRAEPAETPSAESPETPSTENPAVQGVVPELDVNTNPLDAAQDVNPVEKTNPFKEAPNPFNY